MARQTIRGRTVRVSRKSRGTIIRATLVLFLLLLFAPPAGAEMPARVIVTSNGWHTGIVLPPSSTLAEAIPELADFGEVAYFEFGWGDADYYPAERPGLGSALAAAFPGPAVVHVAALPDHPSRVFPNNEWVEIALTNDGKASLIDFLGGAFARDGEPRVQPSASGLYAFSLFYPATGRFSLANTCNTWVARGLARAGLPVETEGTQRAEDVMRQLRPQ